MKTFKTCKSKNCDITSGNFKGEDKQKMILCKYCQAKTPPSKLDIALTNALSKYNTEA